MKTEVKALDATYLTEIGTLSFTSLPRKSEKVVVYDKDGFAITYYVEDVRYEQTYKNQTRDFTTVLILQRR